MQKPDKFRPLINFLLQLASLMQHTGLRRKIEEAALQLLEDAAFNRKDKISSAVGLLENLVLIGRELYEIEPVNAGWALERLKEVNPAILQFPIAGLQDIAGFPLQDSKDEEKPEDFSDEEGLNGLNSAIRQSAILEKIRQFAGSGCQFKDITANFPDISERTLRYDLQKLLNQSIINRIGGGPQTTYYVTK